MAQKKVPHSIHTTCPACGTEIAIIGFDEQKPATKNKKEMKAEAKIEALRKAGVNVDNLFSMKGANGQEIIARMNGGELSIVPENDPIFSAIFAGGAVPNSRLFRRWVMAQVFHMLSYRSYYGESGFVAALQCKGYKYQWTMVLEELRVQSKLAENDVENFIARNRWFNREVVAKMCDDYVYKLRKHVEKLTVRHCKGVPYVKLKKTNVFSSDLNTKVYRPLTDAATAVSKAETPWKLFLAASYFFSLAEKWWMVYDTPMSQVFKDAYKGAGAYFTMKNLLLFHGATFKNGCVKLSQTKSLRLLEDKAAEYSDEGWRLFGLMKKLISDSNIDIEAKMAEWRK